MTTDQQAQLERYITEQFAHEDDVLRAVQEDAVANSLPAISVTPFEGRLLQVLLHAVGARKVVEIGALAGYSGIWLARALPADGRLYTLERSGKHAAIARRSFERAGVADRVELLEGPAIDSLQRLAGRGPFDFVFIDADKSSYLAYLAWAADNLRPGGMIAAHNALWGGRVLAPQSDDDHAVVASNRALAEDSRFVSTIIGVGDGLALGVRR